MLNPAQLTSFFAHGASAFRLSDSRFCRDAQAHVFQAGRAFYLKPEAARLLVTGTKSFRLHCAGSLFYGRRLASGSESWRSCVRCGLAHVQVMLI